MVELQSTDQIKNHLKQVDGVMIGRSIYHSPYFLADIEKDIFSNENISTREEVIKELIDYVKFEIKKGTKLHHIMRHTLRFISWNIWIKFLEKIFK